MKTGAFMCNFLLVAAMTIAFMSVPAACSEVGQEDGNVEFKPIVLTKAQSEVLVKGNDFGFKLLRETIAENGIENNIFLSPLGVTIVSSMLANGAAGATYDEIVETIGMKGLSLDQVNSCYSTLVSGLYKADVAVNLSLANSIWVGSGLNLRKNFRTNMEKTFDAESFSVDFAASGTLRQVNDWCSKKTSGLIPKMFDQLDPRVRMLLINALYFKGTWVHTFSEKNTLQDDFQTLAGTTVKVPMMFQQESLEVYRDKTVTLVRMPYGNGAFVMEAVVPTGDFKKFMEYFSPSRLEGWSKGAVVTPTELFFPKFTTEFDTEEMLVPVLNRLGMRRAFTSAADFSNMSDEGLYVDKFRQKSYITVDEKGTQAAAVTVAEMRKNGGSSNMTVVRFDRPFVYLIREKSTGAILFIGTKVK